MKLFFLIPIAGAAYMLGRMRERRLAQLALLEQMLPVCMFCKSVRGAGDRWEPLEHYVARRAGTEITHGICPGCIESHYPYRGE